MEQSLYRYALFLVLVLLAGGLFAQQPEENPNPDPGGGGSGGGCYVCRGVIYPNGTAIWYCGGPDQGGWGETYCITESYDGTTYCQAFGDSCCVD
jgi:hypothetical protein